MANRLDLQDMLEKILESPEVYFNPPESTKMTYPALRYTLNDVNFLIANDNIYTQFTGYEIILIDRDADSKFVNKLLSMQYVRFVRHYRADGLYHWVFNLYN